MITSSLLLSALLLPLLACCSAQPLGYFTDAQMQRIRAGNCSAATVVRLRAPLDYAPRAVHSMYFSKSDPKSHAPWIADVEGVFQQALKFACGGSPRHAANAVGILRAWSTVNKRFAGPNALLEAAWGTASMARAAALLLRIGAPGWDDVDAAAYADWVATTLRLMWTDKYADSWDDKHDSFNNWHTSLLDAHLALALLNNDTEYVDVAAARFKRIVTAYVRADGYIPEIVSRGMTHAQFAIGGIIQVAEVLYLHGRDLYKYPDGRLARMMEYSATIMNGGVPAGVKRKDLRETEWVMPCGWHLALRHFAGRLGMSMPQTARTYSRVASAYVFHWGLSDIV